MNGIGLRITDIDLLERSDQFAVRVRITLAGGQSAAGVTTESLAGHWHGPGVAPEDFRDICRGALWRARDAYLACARGPSLTTAFACFERNHQPLIDAARRRGEPALIGSVGAALLDRALVDALCRARGLSFASAIRGNAVGIRMLQAGGGADSTTGIGADRAAPDGASRIGRLFGQLGVAAFAAGLTPRPRIAWRLRVEAPDAPAAPLVDGVADFVLGLRGDVREDLERLRDLATRLDALPGYRLALDGDERFASFEELAELMRKLEQEPALRRLHASLAWIEQPLPRDRAFAQAFDPQAIGVPVIVDESDAESDDFARAIAIGYHGVTTDASKGLYLALLNAARCHRASTVHNRLITVAAASANRHGNGLLQQLALAGLLDQPTIGAIGATAATGAIGATVDPGPATAQDQRPYRTAHPDLIGDPDRSGGGLRIENGGLSLESLNARGFGTAVDPDFASWTPMPQPPDGLLQRNYSQAG